MLKRSRCVPSYCLQILSYHVITIPRAPSTLYQEYRCIEWSYSTISISPWMETLPGRPVFRGRTPRGMATPPAPWRRSATPAGWRAAARPRCRARGRGGGGGSPGAAGRWRNSCDETLLRFARHFRIIQQLSLSTTSHTTVYDGFNRYIEFVWKLLECHLFSIRLDIFSPLLHQLDENWEIAQILDVSRQSGSPKTAHFEPEKNIVRNIWRRISMEVDSVPRSRISLLALLIC